MAQVWQHEWELVSPSLRICRKCKIEQTKHKHSTGRIIIGFHNPKWLPDVGRTCSIKMVK